MRLRLIVLSLLCACALVFFACSSDEETHNGLALIIATNLRTPADLDAVRLEVFQEKSADLAADAGDRYLSTGTDYTFRVPDEQQLPGTFTIAAGTAADQNAYIRITGLKSGKPIVLREIKVQIPATRLAQYLVVLSAECVNRLVIDGTGRPAATCDEPDETCLPDSKEADKCGSSFVDSTKLVDYAGNYKEVGTLPLAPIPEAGVETGTDTGPEPIADAGDEAGDANDGAVVDGGPPGIAQFSIKESGGGDAYGIIDDSGGTIFVVLSKGSDLKGLTTSIAVNGGGTVTPASGEPHDFDGGPVVYTVKSATGAVKTYAVTVQRPIAPAPTFTPAPAQFATGPVTVNVTPPFSGAAVHYTLDGTAPTAASPTAPSFTVMQSSTQVLWRVIADGYRDGQGAGTYFISMKAFDPTFSEPAGQKANPITITLQTATSNAVMCYRNDGQPPNCNAGACTAGATTYTAPFIVDAAPTAITVRAIACRNDLTTSGVAFRTYTFKVAAPLFDKPSGNYPVGTTVTATSATLATATDPVTLHYIIGATGDPGCNGTAATGTAPIQLPAGHTTVRMRACNTRYQSSDLTVTSFDAP